MTIIIDHERYGVRAEFTDIADAETTIHACGPEFADTKFSIAGGLVYDDAGYRVGEVVE